MNKDTEIQTSKEADTAPASPSVADTAPSAAMPLDAAASAETTLNEVATKSQTTTLNETTTETDGKTAGNTADAPSEPKDANGDGDGNTGENDTKKGNGKDKDKKEKKKKLPFARSFANNFFAIKLVYKVSPLYLMMYFGSTLIYAPLDFLSGSYLIRIIVDGVENNSPPANILTYMIVIGVSSIIISVLNNLFWNVYSPKYNAMIGAAAQKMIFRKSAEVELACYETPAFYDKYVKAMDEAYDRVWKVLRTLDNFNWRVISLLANSLLLFTIDPWLIVFGLLPLLLGFVRRWSNVLKHDFNVDKKPIDRRMKYVRRTFYLNEYAKEMRIGGMYVRMLDELEHTYREYKALFHKYGFRRALAEYIQRIGLEVITILGTMLYAVWSAVAVGPAAGGMSIGDCIVILNSIGTVSYCLSSMVQTFADFGEHALFLEDVRYFLDYEPKMVEDPDAMPAHGGDIELCDVSFRYEGAEQDALKGVNMTVHKGERIALVGQNGSGKTTLVKLLLRLYDPTSGKITLDGVPAPEYRLSSYRDNFSTVFQDFKVFSMSVQDNVLMRREREGDGELVTEALRESGAYDKIMSLERGVGTTLTREFDDKGANLSVGEQQKVSLARVFAGDAPCVILDEPSSALDPIAEYTMFDNMMRATAGRSVIFISHRLSSAVLADRVYLIDDGTVIEEGTHHELMQAGGKYAEMFTSQARNYIGKEDESNE